MKNTGKKKTKSVLDQCACLALSYNPKAKKGIQHMEITALTVNKTLLVISARSKIKNETVSIRYKAVRRLMSAEICAR